MIQIEAVEQDNSNIYPLLYQDKYFCTAKVDKYL